MGNRVSRVDPPTLVVKYWRFSRVSSKHFVIICHNSCSYTGQTNAGSYSREFEGALKGGVCLFDCWVQISSFLQNCRLRLLKLNTWFLLWAMGLHMNRQCSAKVRTVLVILHERFSLFVFLVWTSLCWKKVLSWAVRQAVNKPQFLPNLFEREAKENIKLIALSVHKVPPCFTFDLLLVWPANRVVDDKLGVCLKLVWLSDPLCSCCVGKTLL